MQWEQVTNEVDQEVIRVSRYDGSTRIEWTPCDSDGHATEFGWVEIATIDTDGDQHYADGDGSTWSEARTFAVNTALRLLSEVTP